MKPIFSAETKIFLGVDRVFDEPFSSSLQGKTIGLITNHTGTNRELVSTIELFKKHEKRLGYTLKAFFAPEHGLYGEGYAGEEIDSLSTKGSIPVYSLHGQVRRPTKKMLQGLDLLVFDIQDLGSRSYTFATTLFYAMEEAAKEHITVLVLDRPNPINGVVVDGPMVENDMRSFVSYLNIPYCHGMTIGELAVYFNKEYKVGCDVKVVPMKGWKRTMSFKDTALHWIPTSPNIPTADTAYFYPTTGILGALSVTSIGIGFTLPFKVVGAPWIDGEKLAKELSQKKLAGIKFIPIRYKPFAGSLSGKNCQGVLLVVDDHLRFLPVTTNYLISVTLKRLYPKEFAAKIKNIGTQRELFFHICGTRAILEALQGKETSFEKLTQIHKKERDAFILARKKYLFAEYN
jgi:uncharacterized protein YbbC (DUF1343 family)